MEIPIIVIEAEDKLPVKKYLEERNTTVRIAIEVYQSGVFPIQYTLDKAVTDKVEMQKAHREFKNCRAMAYDTIVYVKINNRSTNQTPFRPKVNDKAFNKYKRGPVWSNASTYGIRPIVIKCPKY